MKLKKPGETRRILPAKPSNAATQCKSSTRQTSGCTNTKNNFAIRRTNKTKKCLAGPDDPGGRTRRRQRRASRRTSSSITVAHSELHGTTQGGGPAYALQEGHAGHRISGGTRVELLPNVCRREEHATEPACRNKIDGEDDRLIKNPPVQRFRGQRAAAGSRLLGNSEINRGTKGTEKRRNRTNWREIELQKQLQRRPVPTIVVNSEISWHRHLQSS